VGAGEDRQVDASPTPWRAWSPTPSTTGSASWSTRG